MHWLSKTNQRLLLEHLGQLYIKEYGTEEQSTHLKIGMDTVNISLGFEVKKLLFYGILWVYWTKTMIPVNKPYISEINFVRCFTYHAESFMSSHRFVFTEIHWYSGWDKL